MAKEKWSKKKSHTHLACTRFSMKTSYTQPTTRKYHIFESILMLKPIQFQSGIIPVVMNKEAKMYESTIVFGTANVKQTEYTELQLWNFFSTKFAIEIASKREKKCFTQTWHDYMSKISLPKIDDYNGNDDYTQIEFCPDLIKFNKMKQLDDDIVALLFRRAYDVSFLFEIDDFLA